MMRASNRAFRERSETPGALPARRAMAGLIAGTLCVLVVFLSGCGSDATSPVEGDNDECPAGQWDEDTGGWYAYSHDCRPYTGDHFTIYSDGSSLEAKRFLAQIAEEIFAELVPEFLIESISDELQFTDDYTYYIYAEKHLDPILAMGYRNGFFIGAIDCTTVPGYYTGNPSRYRRTLKHELTHVFQFTLTDCPSNAACPYWLGVWFREGQAVYMSGAGENARVTTVEELNQWYSDQSRISPISIHRWTDFPDPDRGGEYYPVFGLAYAYLVDTAHGHGATMADMREMFQLMKDGEGFKVAFEDVFGFSVGWYEENFRSLMEQYLTSAGSRISLGLEVKMDQAHPYRSICPGAPNSN
jgi:hypothetical protein